MIGLEFFRGLPLEYEPFLINKYSSVLTTCKYIEINHPGENFHYILVKKENKLVELLIFSINGNAAKCYNKLVLIDQSIIVAFVQMVFEEFRSVKNVEIAASYNSYSLNKSFLVSHANDFVLSLPFTLNDYFQELGTQTRRHLKNYKSRLTRDYPQALFVIKSKNEIDRESVDRIIQLNIDRMVHKGIIPGKTDTDKEKYYNYALHHGYVTYIEIENTIVAGCIAVILNKTIFLMVVAHDDQFSKYNVGQLAILNLIEQSIEMNLSEMHFLWGENDYKLRLLAKPKPIFSYQIYRSYSFDFVLSYAKALVSRVKIQVRQSKYAKPIRDAVKSYRKKKLSS